jgi:hypothetical protein
MKETPESISILDAVNAEVCNSIVNKINNGGRLTPWDQTPWVLVVDEPDVEEQAFIDAQIDYFLNKCREVYNPKEEIYFLEGWLTCWPQGNSMHEHIDNWDPNIESRNIIFSSVLYLNDDFEGGEIYFPNLGNFTYKPKQGNMIIFPTESYEEDFKYDDAYGFKHLHGIRLIESGNRYTLTLWAAKK